MRVENAAKDLIFLENLVLIERLRIPQLAEHARVDDDQRVGGDGLRRILEVVGDPLDEKGHVIEQIVGWENAIGGERNSVEDPLEPTAGEVGPCFPHSLR